MTAPLPNIAAVEEAARKAVRSVAITDVHTHLFPPSHGNLLLWGVNELLTYHYLVSELFTVAPKSLTYEKFWKLSKAAQADLVWEHIFLRRAPLSEAARGVLTCLTALGLDVSSRKLDTVRAYFARQEIGAYVEKVLDCAGLDYAVMTNNPFVPAEVEHWQARRSVPDRLKTALRIDTMLIDWPAAARQMRAQDYKTAAKPTTASFAAARKFLVDWAKKIKPLYMAASLSNEFAYPSRDIATAVLDKVVAPVAKEMGLPVALMVGVRRGVNPNLHEGGDALGATDVMSIGRLCQKHPDAKFLITTLARVDQHELCVLARKFRNLHVFGCWWFCNDPSIIDEMTRMRLELLGTAVTLQHSDSRVLDQLIYKWRHSRTVIGNVLADKYRDLYIAGWRPTAAEIQKSARTLLGGAFEEFLAK